MAIYPCRICGNPMDPIYSDGICDDCYFGQSSFLPLKNDKKSRASSRSARSASSGKKKRKKIQKAAALIMALMIALSCFSFSASAEGNFLGDTSPLEFDGTYMGYDVIKYDEDFSISFAQLQNLIIETAPEGTTKGTWYLAGALLQFDSSGNPIIYSTGTEGYAISCTADFSKLKDDPYDSNFMYAFFKSLNTKNSYSFNKQYGSYTDLYWTYGAEHIDIKVNLVDKKLESKEYSEVLTYTNLVEGFNGFVGTGDVYLLLYISDQSYTDNAIASQLLAGNKDSDFESNKAPANYSAKFHSFASMNDGDVILNMLDWIGAGKQYPTADFSINDNGQYHSYSLRISLNKNYVDTCMTLWEDWRKGVIGSVSSVVGARGLLLMPFYGGDSESFVKDVFNLGGLGPVSLFGVTLPTESGTAAAIRKIAQYNMLKSLDDLSYVTQYNLTNGYLNFNEGESPVRAYSVCLADYVTIVKGLLYRLDIVDNDTGLILDTAYFCNDTTYQKTDSGYGCKVYNYDNADNLDNDLDNDNGYSSSIGKVETDKMQSDNNTDIVVNFDPNGLDLSSYMDSLNGLVSDVSSFFTWSWALFPPEIMTIVIIGVGLLVVCGLVKFFVG